MLRRVCLGLLVVAALSLRARGRNAPRAFHRLADFTPRGGFRSSQGEQAACLLLTAEPLMRIYSALQRCHRFTSFGSTTLCDGDAVAALYIAVSKCCTKGGEWDRSNVQWRGNADCVARVAPVLQALKSRVQSPYVACVGGTALCGRGAWAVPKKQCERGITTRCRIAKRSVLRSFAKLVGGVTELYRARPTDMSPVARGFLGQFLYDEGDEVKGYRDTAGELLADVRRMCRSEGDCRDKIGLHIDATAKKYGFDSRARSAPLGPAVSGTPMPLPSSWPTPAPAPTLGPCKFSPWSRCTSSCGQGHQQRVRLTPGKGRLCRYKSESRLCSSAACPHDCAMLPWGGWGDCTHTCGTGQQERHRDVKTEQRFGGADCPVDEQRRACNTRRCPQNGLRGQHSKLMSWRLGSGVTTQRENREAMQQQQHHQQQQHSYFAFEKLKRAFQGDWR